MFTLTAEKSFDSAHFLAGYEGKCSNLHGHRWRVLAEVQSERLQESGQERGMVMDFGALKKSLKSMTDELDHSLIYEQGTLREKTVEALMEEEFRLIPVAFRPTAENFAMYFYHMLAREGFPVNKVTVYETPNNCASYQEGRIG